MESKKPESNVIVDGTASMTTVATGQRVNFGEMHAVTMAMTRVVRIANQKHVEPFAVHHVGCRC